MDVGVKWPLFATTLSYIVFTDVFARFLLTRIENSVIMLRSDTVMQQTSVFGIKEPEEVENYSLALLFCYFQIA